ncbi:MAG: hypothetical protein WD342_21030 [Verrucomicrobiales bacterium]
MIISAGIFAALHQRPNSGERPNEDHLESKRLEHVCVEVRRKVSMAEVLVAMSSMEDARDRSIHRLGVFHPPCATLAGRTELAAVAVEDFVDEGGPTEDGSVGEVSHPTADHFAHAQFATTGDFLLDGFRGEASSRRFCTGEIARLDGLALIVEPEAVGFAGLRPFLLDSRRVARSSSAVSSASSSSTRRWKWLDRMPTESPMRRRRDD